MSFLTIVLKKSRDNRDADVEPGSRHVDLKGNLIKAMMVMNWLNMIEVEKF